MILTRMKKKSANLGRETSRRTARKKHVLRHVGPAKSKLIPIVVILQLIRVHQATCKVKLNLDLMVFELLRRLEHYKKLTVCLSRRQ